MNMKFWKVNLLSVLFSMAGLIHSVVAAEVLIHGPEVDLTVEDMRWAFAAMPEKVRKQTLQMPSSVRKAIDQTYMTKVAAHRAEQKHLDQKSEVKAKIWNYQRNVLAEAEVAAVIQAAVIQRELASEADYEAAARELYLARKDRYERPEQVLVSHILFKNDNGKSDQELLKEIRQLRQKILSGKLQFDIAAVRYSQDKGSASKGGRLRPFTRGRMVKPFEETAFSLKEGEISQPVKTRFGYHLIKVEKRIPKRVISFDDVRDELVKEVKGTAASELRTDYWLKIRDDPRVELNEELLNAFLKQPERVMEGKE